MELDKGSEGRDNRRAHQTAHVYLRPSLLPLALRNPRHSFSEVRSISLGGSRVPGFPLLTSRSTTSLQLVLYVRRFGRSDATSLRIAVALTALFSLLHDLEVWAIGVTK